MAQANISLKDGRAASEPSRSNQSYFIGYFGIQILLPPKSYKTD